jgi:hypothetical protein
MRVRLSIAGLILVALSLSGCASMCPDWLRPGPIQYQRYNAMLHDPYPDNDAGPEVVGGRPREFQKPLAEPARNRYLRDVWWR